MLKRTYLIFGAVVAVFASFSSFHVEAQSLPEKTESITNIFYVRPEMRTKHDQIEISGSTLKMAVWYDLPPNPNTDQIECLAYRWLLGGRGQRLGHGAAEIFKRHKEIEQIQLEMFELDFKTESVDGRGKLRKVDIKRPYARVAAHRSYFQDSSKSQQEWKSSLWGGLADCLQTGRSYRVRKDIR